MATIYHTRTGQDRYILPTDGTCFHTRGKDLLAWQHNPSITDTLQSYSQDGKSKLQTNLTTHTYLIQGELLAGRYELVPELRIASIHHMGLDFVACISLRKRMIYLSCCPSTFFYLLLILKLVTDSGDEFEIYRSLLNRILLD